MTQSRLEDRLVALREEGRTREAVELARAVLRNENVRDLAVDADAVRLETDHFVGEHPVRNPDSDHPAIVPEGSYSYKPASFDFTFTTTTIDDDVRERAEAQLTPAEADPAEDADETDSPMRPDDDTNSPEESGGRSGVISRITTALF